MAQSWSLPIRGGWSNGVTSGDPQLGDKRTDGFVGTFGAALRLNPEISIEFDLAYTQKGAEGTVTNEVASGPSSPPQPNVYTFNGETSLDYLEFWTMVVPHLHIADTSELKGYLGLSLNTLINSQVTGTFNGMAIDQDLSDGLRGIDSGVLVGAGITYDVKSVVLTLDFIAEFGLVNINQSVLEELDFKTQAFYTMLGVSIPLHHDE